MKMQMVSNQFILSFFTFLLLTTTKIIHGCGDFTFTGTKVLNAGTNFQASYKIQNDKLILQLKSSTTGWLGFGFSESGYMSGSDVVTVGVNSSNLPFLQDRFVPFAAFPDISPYPDIDKCNHWTMLCYSQENGVTDVVITRLLNTGDSEDRVINSQGSNVIIFSWGDFDTVAYHGVTNRGTTSIDFSIATEVTFQVPSDVDSSFLVKMNNYAMTTAKTQYITQRFDVGASTRHIVAVELVIPSVDAPYVHHMLLHDCGLVNTTSPLCETPGSCIRENIPELLFGGSGTSPLGFGACKTLVYGWAIGGLSQVWPAQVGYRVGATSSRYLVLEIHLNNPNQDPGKTISSGVRLHMTSTLRNVDSGVLILGDPAVQLGNQQGQITAGQANAHYEGTCPTNCTLAKFTQNLTVFATFPHMHGFGKQIWSSIHRPSTTSSVVSFKQFWNFEFQTQTTGKFEIFPGDKFSTHCIYDTTKASVTTNFGLASTQEMCMDFWFYYPKQSNIGECGTAFSNTQTICGSASDSINVANPQPDGDTSLPSSVAIGLTPVTCNEFTVSNPFPPANPKSGVSTRSSILSCFILLFVLLF